jgi:hypothetical protein
MPGVGVGVGVWRGRRPFGPVYVPPGFILLIDADGAFLIDADGYNLMEPV